MIRELWHCILALPYRSFYAARDASRHYALLGSPNTLYNCRWCGKWHLKSR
jgi:hypothetical protein